MMQVAGEDATFDFEEAGHSHAARKLLESYLVGELVDGSAESNGGESESSPERDELLWRAAAGEAMDPDACKSPERVGTSLAERGVSANGSGGEQAGDGEGGSHRGGDPQGAERRGVEVQSLTPQRPHQGLLPSMVTWWERQLDTPLMLSCGLREVRLKGKNGATVCLVGTAHVSKQSIADVRKVIRMQQPKVVAVELCEARKAMLLPMAPQDLSLAGVAKALREKDNNLFSVLYGYFLASVSEKMEVVPGGEFRAAYEVNRAKESGCRPCAVLCRCRSYILHLSVHGMDRSGAVLCQG
jgi:hypothetical protein